MSEQKEKNQEQKAFIHMPPMAELSTEEARRQPYPILKQLRENTPVRYDEKRQVWDVFLYEDVSRVLKDSHTFSTNFNYAGALSDNDSLFSVGPVRHREIRGMVDRAFTPKAVQNLAPRIRDIANDLLDDVADNGQMNTVLDFSGPLPVIVIAEMLGVPIEDRIKFKTWSDAMLTGVNNDSEEAYQEVVRNQQQARIELMGYFQNILNQRKEQPQDDLISALWQINSQEEVISEQGLLRFCMSLLVAGNETTTNMITNGVRILCDQPELQTRLLQDRSLIPAFVEEVLRMAPPGGMLPRRAAEDVVLQGQQIKAGQMLHVWLVSANRDESKFPNAEEFRLDRTQNQHLSFGFGSHFCLGAPLARLEGQIAFEVLINRIANLQKAGDAELQVLPFPMFTSVKEYPITFTKVDDTQ